MVEEGAEDTNLVNGHKINVFKNGINTVRDREMEEFQPPDGGTRAWMVMIGSFFCNGIVFSVINSYSVLYAELHENLKKKGSENPSSEAALVGSLAMGTTFLVSAVSGVLTDYIGLRCTTFLGGLIAASGMFLSSFFVDNVNILYITFGIMYGLGCALVYTPSLAVLAHYFKRYLGVVNGIVTSGSSIFTIAMPYVMDSSLKKFGISWTLRLLALIASFNILISFLFKPTNPTRKKIKLENAFNLEVWKNPKYVTWAVVIAISLCGYFVPYVYMLKFVEASLGKEADGKLPVLCIGITSGIGRLLFGYIGDFPNANRVLLQQLAFLSIGILTMLLPVSTSSFSFVILISLGMGLFDGCFISLLGPIAFDICGPDGGTQAIGFLLGLSSVPLIVGPYIAGLIFEKQQSYTIPFILAGIPPTVGSVAMFLTRCVHSRKIQDTTKIHLNSNGLTEPADGQREDVVP